MKINVHSEYENDHILFNHSTKIYTEREEGVYHYHDVCELLFVKSGDMVYEVNGKRYNLKKNMLVLSRANERHNISSNSSEDYERYNILFNESDMDIYKNIPPEVNVVSFEANNAVIGIFDKMDFYAKRIKGDVLGKLLFNMIYEVLVNVVIETENAENGEQLKVSPLIAKAIDFISENLLTLESVEQVCEALFVSKSHLHHMFMREMKISPKKYIILKRLELARRELMLGIKATEVYSACGFNDYSSFYRVYKRYFGHSPKVTPKSECVRITFSDFIKGYKS